MPITTYKRIASAPIAVAGTSNVQTLYSNNVINAIGSTLIICNTTNVAQTYRVAIHTITSFEQSPGWIAYDTTINANDSAFITVGLILDSLNRHLLISGSSTGLVFSLFGTEVSV